MQSWILNEAKKLSLENIEQEPDLKTEAKVKISRAALSSSDFAAYLGKYEKYPLILSRIALGFISESRDICFQKGQRVMLSPYTRGEEKQVLVNGIDLNGYLSDYTIAPLNNIYSVPDGISDESIAFIEEIALALKVFDVLEIKKTKYVLICGCTSINLIIAQLCLYYQAIPIIVDKDKQYLDLADGLGVYYLINPSEDELKMKLNEITSGKLVDHLIIDTDAFPETDEDILKVLSNKGNVGLVGFNKKINNMKFNVAPVIEKRLTIFGINDGIGEIETAINMIATGIVKVDKLIEKVVAFNEVPDTIKDLSEKRNRFKTLVKC